jgi:drug/metabolite transporter (DMT)-like permease
VAGIIGMAGYNWFVNAGFELVPAGVGTLVTMIEPLMIAILAAMLLGEKLTLCVHRRRLVDHAGASCCSGRISPRRRPEVCRSVGIVYLLICCVGWAIYTIAVEAPARPL